MHKITTAVCFLVLITSVSSCHVDESRQQDHSVYSYAKPKSINDDIPVNTAAAHNIDPSKLAELVNAIRQEQIKGMDSLLVAINNELVLEEYFAGWERNDIHDLRSSTKSITSLLAGIAIGLEGQLGPHSI